MENTKLNTYNWPLNGRLITKLDGTLLPDAHFQVLENLRYNDGGIEGVKGMTKINASALAKLKVQNGFHFKKSSPVDEDHVFVQVTNPTDGTSAIYKSDNSTEVPSQDTYTLFKTLSEMTTTGTNKTVYFSEAPDQSMVMCDGYHNYIWSGDEYRAARVVNFDPAGTFFKDVTTVASNNLHDTGDTFLVSGVTDAVDAETVLLIHAGEADGTAGTDIIDSSATPHTLTAVADAQVDTAQYKFGTGSLKFDGTGDYITIPDHADWNFGTGDFTIDTHIRLVDDSVTNGLCGQYTDTDNYWLFYYNNNKKISFAARASGVQVAMYDTGVTSLAENTWHHIELDRSGTNVYIFINGVPQTLTVTTPIASNAMPDLGGVLYVGAHRWEATITGMYGWMDEFRISKGIARHTATFAPPSVAYGGTTTSSLYVASTRPLTGVKFYVDVANTTAATSAGYEWTGSAWSLLTTTDGTVTTGKTLAKTGTITFPTTVATSKVKAIHENMAYWYLFKFYNIDATTALYQVTVQAPVQDIVDIWDGVPRQMFSNLVYTTAYADKTTNTYNLDYDSTDETTYADISALQSTHYIYAGFAERMLGMKVYLGGIKTNTNAALTAISYWNGTAWTSVGEIDDGTLDDATSPGTKTFNKSGVITWNDPGIANEFPRTIGNSSEWYFYRIERNATFSANVYLDTIVGIPVQADVRPHRYPVLWQNRLFLLNDQSANKNTATGSSYGTNCVFNGTDAGTLVFGGSKEINCGKTLFTRYGGSLYENLIVCKNNETYLVDGTSFQGDANGSGAFVVYQVSGTRGCIAPLTMQCCDTGYEVAPGITKHILAWLSNSGVVMFDSNSIIEVSNDIGDRFFRDRTNSMSRTICDKSAGFYDTSKGEYHVLIPVGSTATYLNEEWAYDVIRKKWFQIKRGAKYLWCGFQVEDPYGNQYVYGGTGDGFIERLDYGTTFDGVGIAYKFRLPDSLMNASWDNRKEIRQIRLVGVCKTTTTQTVAISHYGDGSSTATTPSVIAVANNKTGRRFYKFARSVSFIANTHSLEFSITTTDEVGGFDPLFVSGTYRVLDHDVEAA